MGEKLDFLVCYLSKYIGDYHAPRLKKLSDDLNAKGAKLSIAQFSDRSEFYRHGQFRRRRFLNALHVTNFSNPKGVDLALQTWSYLQHNAPDHILVLGYSDIISLVCLLYAKISGKKIYFMSDSKADDQPRKRVTELLKSFIVKRFNGALVAGNRHASYFRSLGFRGKISTGYDVVDNAYFFKGAQRFRGKNFRQRSLLPPKYIICVSKLVQKKRVDRVIDIVASSNAFLNGYRLVLIGEGPEEGKILQEIERRGIQRHVDMYLSVKNGLMPFFYSGASCIILASEFDQWGLCINEAMACGVPAIVSARAGVAGEIVLGETGIIFDGDDIGPAILGLNKLIEDRKFATQLSENCIAKMRDWDLDAFSRGAMELIFRS